MKALRLTNHEALLMPEISGAVQPVHSRMTDSPMQPRRGAWAAQCVNDPNTLILIARDEEMKFVGLMISDFDAESIWSPDPCILHLYSEAPDATDALLPRFRNWGVGLGQQRFRAISRANRSTDPNSEEARKRIDESYVAHIKRVIGGEVIERNALFVASFEPEKDGEE